ncbi:LAQU0S06e04962g1_1 [Lachancea quebecensis]|uniref:LAQU0S06e04962g1_1 n=1 Tax=Lachancea quebecensis TaxID=1654605 RepID=A0A0P1KSC2_9SACH|nr:LAQU0S06e04962g1_1 [Lachancea quebecensis]
MWVTDFSEFHSVETSSPSTESGGTKNTKEKRMSTSINDIPVDFKSTLPPRKRAKTKEEKEQRRIERILRNRRAAHQSREKKRLHLQHLERKACLLEQILAQVKVEELVKNDTNLRVMYDEYQSLAMEPLADSPSGDLHDHMLDSQKTPESLDASSHVNCTPVSQPALFSSPSPAFESPLSQPQVKRESVTDESFEAGLVQPNMEFNFDTSVPDVNNWNLLLTNDTENLTSSTNEDEPPVFDMTDNSWALDPTRDPAVIRHLLRV